jgi:hypothetical protein
MRSPDFFFPIPPGPCPNPQQFRPVRRTPSGRTHRHSSIRPAGRPTATSQPSGAAPSAAKGIGFIRASERAPCLASLSCGVAVGVNRARGPVASVPGERSRHGDPAEEETARASSGAVPIRSRIPDPTARIKKKKKEGAALRALSPLVAAHVAPAPLI